MNSRFDIDTIGRMSDSDLQRKMGDIKSEINLRNRDREPTQNLEIDLCYFHRESETRTQRRLIHEEYTAERKNNRNIGNR